MMARRIRTLVSVAGLCGTAALSTVSCKPEHGHQHAPPGAHPHAKGQAATNQMEDGDRYRHADDHPQGHDHHAPGHGHSGPVARITHFSESHELFAEYSPAVANQPLSLLTHLTYLEGFKPVADGPVRLTLAGPETLSAVANRADRPGIFTLSVLPTQPGIYRAELRIDGTTPGTLSGFSITVHATQHAAQEATAEHHDDEGAISFLKEQQWKVPFSTVRARIDELQSRVQVQGVVDTPPGGSANIAAPIAGRVVPPRAGLPSPGQWIAKGQRLASLSPMPGAPEEAARATLAVAVAEARIGAAKAALKRAKTLQAANAISARDFEEAQREARLAQEAAKAANRADALYKNAARGSSTGSWHINAPIAGLLTDVGAEPGANVQANDPLFRIIDTRTLWLRARVPEPIAAQLALEAGPSYRIAGHKAWRALNLSDAKDGPPRNAELVHVSPRVDPKTRTVDVLYSLREPPSTLRVNGMVEVALATGTPFHGVVVPALAVINDNDRHLIYVQTDGEHFEERAVRVTPISAGRIGIIAGLKKGERIVVQGANVVRLSARSSATPGHGHLH